MKKDNDRNDLVYYRCPQCHAVGYLPREFCPVCANPQRERCRALGVGTLTAMTTLTHDPRDPGTTAPGICLVTFDEGFTAMARCAVPLATGARVAVAGFDGPIPVVQTAEDVEAL